MVLLSYNALSGSTGFMDDVVKLDYSPQQSCEMGKSSSTPAAEIQQSPKYTAFLTTVFHSFIRRIISTQGLESDGPTIVPNVTDIEDGSVSSTSTKTSNANRMFLEKYRALDLAGHLEQSFPSFSDPSIKNEYRSWQQHSVAAVTCVLALVLVDFPYNFTRFNLAFVDEYEHPFTISSQIVAIPTFTLFGLYVVVQFYLSYYGRNPGLSADDVNNGVRSF